MLATRSRTVWSCSSLCAGSSGAASSPAERGLSQLSTVDPTAVLQPSGSPLFHTALLSLPQLLSADFVASALRTVDTRGEQLYALSVCTPLDSSDAFALTPDGASPLRTALSLISALQARCTSR